MKKLSQELSGIKRGILSTLPKVDERLLNSNSRLQSGTIPTKSRIVGKKNQEANDYRRHYDLHLEVSK